MNYHLLKTINGWSGNHALDEVMKFVAKDLIFVVFAAFALVCLVVLRRRKLDPLWAAGATLALAYLLGLGAAAVHSEKRPFTVHPNLHRLIPHGAGQSFPSDHATAAFAIAFATLAFLSLASGALFFLTALLIGFARVYAGVHYPGDILGSFVVAFVAVLIVIAASIALGRRALLRYAFLP
jgi:undecaprenyl-diphosphatase